MLRECACRLPHSPNDERVAHSAESRVEGAGRETRRKSSAAEIRRAGCGIRVKSALEPSARSAAGFFWLGRLLHLLRLLGLRDLVRLVGLPRHTVGGLF